MAAERIEECPRCFQYVAIRRGKWIAHDPPITYPPRSAIYRYRCEQSGAKAPPRRPRRRGAPGNPPEESR
jgi:hypothetical protein